VIVLGSVDSPTVLVGCSTWVVGVGLVVAGVVAGCTIVLEVSGTDVGENTVESGMCGGTSSEMKKAIPSATSPTTANETPATKICRALCIDGVTACSP
jgi:hypothetical protein